MESLQRRSSPASLLLLSVSFFLAVSAAAAMQRASSSSGSTDFIKSSCAKTRYPALCTHLLLPYAGTIRRSPMRLAQVALSASLASARSASAFVSRVVRRNGVGARDLGAVRDCVDIIGDSMEELARSIKELRAAGQRSPESVAWQMSNVQTWVSAALTDESTCMDGFPVKGSRVGREVRQKIVGVAQVTSNALALVRGIA